MKKIAAAAGEEGKLLLAFHALGNDIQSQRFRHVDNAAHDDAVPFRTCNVLGKAAVDLEIIERQGFQIGETGIADRKSVVEGKSVSVRVDLGGRRIIKKQKKKK